MRRVVKPQLAPPTGGTGHEGGHASCLGCSVWSAWTLPQASSSGEALSLKSRHASPPWRSAAVRASIALQCSLAVRHPFDSLRSGHIVKCAGDLVDGSGTICTTARRLEAAVL